MGLKLTVFSSIHKNIKKKFRAICDKSQIAKNIFGATSKAINEIEKFFTILMSGSIFSNRWSHMYGDIALLRGHPFLTKKNFLNFFGSHDSAGTIYIPPSKLKVGRI